MSSNVEKGNGVYVLDAGMNGADFHRYIFHVRNKIKAHSKPSSKDRSS